MFDLYCTQTARKGKRNKISEEFTDTPDGRTYGELTDKVICRGRFETTKVEKVETTC